MRWPSKFPLCSIILLSLAISACTKENSVAIRVGTNIWPGYEPLYLARNLGEWSDDTIKLIEYPSASEVIRAFRNRSIEAASLTLDEVLLLRQDDIPVTVVLVHDISDGADVIMAKPGIKNIRQLKGKTVALESGALGAFVVTRALQKNGLTIKDISIYPADINVHESAYKSGAADAVVTFEPVRTKLLNAGAIEIFNSKEIPDEIVDVLVVHNDYLQNHVDQVEQLITGWFKGVDYLKSSPTTSSTIISNRLKISPKEVLAGYDGLHIPNLEENMELLAGDNAKLNSTTNKLYEILKDNELIRPDVNFDKLFSSTYLPTNQ